MPFESRRTTSRMCRTLNGRLALILTALCAVEPATAQEGPPIGAEQFTPVLGFNPGCALKNVTPPVRNLAVIKYEDKVYGYVRYCAVPTPSGVKVKLINEWTNGHKRFLGVGDGDTLCSAHVWVKRDGSPAVFATHRVGVNAKSSRVLVDEFDLSREDFAQVSEWRWSFRKCDKVLDKLVCVGVAAVTQKFAEGYMGFQSPVAFSNACGK